jgi:hypothetical protein
LSQSFCGSWLVSIPFKKVLHLIPKALAAIKMKVTALFLIIVLLISCQPKEHLKRRFDFNKISQTAFDWHWDDSLLTRTFYISYYIECDSNGHCLIAKRDSLFLSPIHFFEATLPTTFDSLLNTINFSKLDSSYEPKNEDHLITYWGFPYCFTFEDKQHFTKYIRILPTHIDPLIIKLVKSFEKIALNSRQPSADTINLNPISKYIQTTLIDTSKFPVYSKIEWARPKSE